MSPKDTIKEQPNDIFKKLKYDIEDFTIEYKDVVNSLSQIQNYFIPQNWIDYLVEIEEKLNQAGSMQNKNDFDKHIKTLKTYLIGIEGIYAP